MTYRQFGNPPLVMWDSPKRSEAVHQPAKSLFEARDSIFCSKPRNRNSSGQAVKRKMARPVRGSAFQSYQRGAKEMKCKASPRGIAMTAKATKLARMKNPQ